MSADFTPKKEDYKILTPFKRQVLTNFPYIEADFDALTNYQLLCKIVEYLNNVIHNENTVTKQITSLYNAYISLQNYVNTYFDNLDIQTEVNKKLDAMAEDGTLADMIAEYIKMQGLLVYNSVDDMKNAENIQNGSFLKTFGYYNYNDGGGALYKARTITNEDIIDNATIIALKDPTLVAEYIPDTIINIKQFGCYCDNIHDDTDAIQKAINYGYNNKLKIYGYETFSKISKTLMIPVPININTLYLKSTNDISEFTNAYMIYLNTTNGSTWDVQYNSFTDNSIENIKLYNENTENILNGFKSIANVQIHNITSYGLNKTFDSSSDKYVDCIQIKNCMISHKTGSNYAIDIGALGDMVNISDVHIFETIGDNYLINLSGAHRPSMVSNIINGIIRFSYGNMTLQNYHGEGDNKSYIMLNNGNYTLDTLCITDNKPCIRLDNAKANINNFNSQYNYNRSYSVDNDIELSNNSSIELNNSYKDVTVVGNANSRLLSPIVTNVNNLNLLNNQAITNYNNIYKNDLTFIIEQKYIDSSIRELTSGTWQNEAGTYYYKMIQCYDNVRGICSNYTATRNITVGENAHAIQIEMAVKNMPIRILRGTSSSSFTQYADIFLIDPVIRDNGSIVNGNIWKTFDEPVSAVSGNTGYTEIKYTGSNIIAKRNAYPTSGTFKAGDIIINNSPSAGNPLAWICTTDGTPGTWTPLSNFPE